MTIPLPLTDDQLVSELWARDVRFLMGEQLTPEPVLDPSHLIASLAQSDNARVRMALIPLFLRHPEFSEEVERAENLISSQDDLRYLHFYYTAARLLQEQYWQQIKRFLIDPPKLQDLFSGKLGISLHKHPGVALKQLAEHHKISSGQKINWLGTYNHGADVWLKVMELQKA